MGPPSRGEAFEEHFPPSRSSRTNKAMRSGRHSKSARDERDPGDSIKEKQFVRDPLSARRPPPIDPRENVACEINKTETRTRREDITKMRKAGLSPNI